MPQRFNDPALMEALGTLAGAAGERIMAHHGCSAAAKTDGSPVTAADEEAEAIILAGLAQLLPGVPILAEESAAAGRLPDRTDLFIAVDPLDGTREFLAGNGEFTVNIALVAGGEPVAGIVYAPARHRLWLGAAGKAEAMTLVPGAAIAAAQNRTPIRTRPVPAGGPVALVSRSHPEAAAEDFLARHGVTRRQPMGSSLKYAVIAEGGADLTVRFAPITEWDIAAGHALLVAAGGRMAMPDGRPISYGRAEIGFKTASFLASSGALKLSAG
ncbi:3'(2'),5'-bisphosphate nucleotidase CysQ family protein [Phreatobacter sp. AB_2022a]|uniref:3'(2'),5'-bisphosphate nucleotidase CysQ family protein n=1 Tax=Phreatobacter sp. AB_2022a TaxID=3003134 RepID=UPI0022875EB8|nr:3'(2'),5'-bisphosphate nucleotidase CysQ [Phreatobacter sp. AB_2022a]MCZ0738312.1 3'(2'),5'-bisphosphate nucleotidase CysQ [Phreatobacter sp. AB_2022a]